MLPTRTGAALLLIALGLPLAVAAAGIQDVVDAPAMPSALAARSLQNGLAMAGQRVIAVGQRGQIVYSDDGGTTWRQAKVPVSSDLVAVSFPSAQHGWAVGHDGIVLHSADAGATWSKQLDGRTIGQTMVAYYAAAADSGTLGTPEAATKLVDEIKRLAAQGAEIPFLDVWFANENTGFAVGAFNLIVRTDDGGRTWTPWFERTDNPKRFHLYSVRGVDGDVYAAGEQGLVLKLDAGSARFRALETPYKGTYFGVTGGHGNVVVFGLRGNALRSDDGGKTWNKIETGLQDGLTAGAAFGERGLVLASQSGRVLISMDGGERFSPLKMDSTLPASAVVALGRDAIAIAGARGVRVQALH